MALLCFSCHCILKEIITTWIGAVINMSDIHERSFDHISQKYGFLYLINYRYASSIRLKLKFLLAWCVWQQRDLLIEDLWMLIAPIIIWKIWTARYTRVFSANKRPPAESIKLIWHMLITTLRAQYDGLIEQMMLQI